MLSIAGKPVFAKAMAGDTEFGLLPAWVFRFQPVNFYKVAPCKRARCDLARIRMANHFFRADLLDSKSKNIASAAVILALASAASSLLGILRDWLLANRFGAGADLDVYYAAFRIPDFIYNILVFGGITVAFLPLFSDYYSKDGKSAWRFANNTLNVFFALLAGLSAILFIFTPQLMMMVAPGFSPDQMAKTVLLSRMMFLSPIIFGVASIFSGILQYFKKFLAYSLAALFYNFGIILGIIFLAPEFGIVGVAAGVIAGALFYLFVQLVPAFRCGFRYEPVFSLGEPSLKRVFGLMLPRTAGIAANQINLIAPTFIGSTLAAGSITVFNLANNIYSLPAGIIGVSFATAAFASFSKYFAQSQTEKLALKFSETYRQIGYLAVPAALLLFVLRRPVVDFLYYHGQFTESDALLTSAVLGLFCLGIYFTAMMPVMFRLFFSLRDTATPTLTTVFSVAANIAMNLWFVAALKSGAAADAARSVFGLRGIADVSVLGLALAYSAANALQFALLVFLFYRKNAVLARTKEILVSFLKTMAAGIFMAVAVYLLIGALPKSSPAQEFLNLAVAGIAGVLIYLLATLLLRAPEIVSIITFLQSKWNKRTEPITTSQN